MCLVPGAKCGLTVAQCSHPVEYRCKFTPRFPEALSILAAEEELLMPQGVNPKTVRLGVVADLDVVRVVGAISTELRSVYLFSSVCLGQTTIPRCLLDNAIFEGVSTG
jgi:hypothetical protein